MRARVQGVAILACTAVVATAGFTAAVASAADSQGAAAMVSRARLQWDRSCATAYQLQTSTNHTTWTTIFSTTTGKGGVEDRTGLTGCGRYLRMLGTHRCRSDGTHGYSLQELDVFGIIGDPQPPTAPGPPAQVSITSNSVTVTWAAATDNIGIAAYDISAGSRVCGTVPGTATPTSSRCSTAPHWTAGPSPGRTVGSSGTARSTVRAPAAAGSTTTRARSAASGGSSTFARSPATTHRRC